MASKRQRKKNEKNALIKRAASLPKWSEKQAENLTFSELKAIVPREEKRAEKNRKARERYNEKKQKIDQYNLEGLKPSDSLEKIEKAIKKKQRSEKYQKTKERNKRRLEESGLLPEDFPKGWQKMGKDKLSSFIPDAQDAILDSGEVWLYIGWGDRAQYRRAADVFGGANAIWYGGRTNDELRDDVKQIVNTKGLDGSSGHSGDTVITYGSRSEVEQFKNFHEMRGYQTIFFGNEFTEHALLSYTMAAIDSSPEDNRDYIVQRVNGFLSSADLKGYRIKTK